jgi:hypothetical protein
MKRGIVLGLGLAGLTVMILGLSYSVNAQGNQWGTVRGRITWGGQEIPKQLPIAAVAASTDKAACLKDGHVVVDEKWVVNPKNKGLRWTFVWLAHEDVKNKAPLPIHPDLMALKINKIVMDQPMCAFAPHAVALREGQVLVAKNSAGISHNFKWTGNPTTANAGNNVLIAPGNAIDIKGLVADRLPVKIECNIHPWMNGWVRIFNHPYYAVTDADGAFEFKDAPAGAYRLIVWHGSGGWRGGAAGKNGQVINIKAGGTLDLGNLDYPPPAE